MNDMNMISYIHMHAIAMHGIQFHYFCIRISYRLFVSVWYEKSRYFDRDIFQFQRYGMDMEPLNENDMIDKNTFINHIFLFFFYNFYFMYMNMRDEYEC